ncbi:DoxX family protein [Micromonospora soli]|uniref:DoxX family protein n=1 Tax=Micromonospora sp. NBRC 110009 TaxID=3061627 RepID=UPI002670FE51|nr:DoxX family protein [Micromonospora sp. NBRC 110009]WKT98475.1 DoxX family protein [Micromonospora sp. NBRC 110009]
MTLAAAILAVLLALIFLALGTAKILAVQPMRERAAEAGFSVAAYRRIGLLEVAGAIGLLLGLIEPLIGTLAGAGLLLLLAGALVVHLRKGDGPQKYAPAVVCGLLVAAYLVLHLAAVR